MCQYLNMLVVNGHGRCKRLGTCLVLEPRASCVVSLQHVPLFEYSVVDGHGRGTQLGTYLVCAPCAVAVVACVTSDGLCYPKSLHARRQHACAICSNNLVLQIATHKRCTEAQNPKDGKGQEHVLKVIL